MDKLIIEGGYPLKGEVTLAGAKNSGFKIFIASLLAESPSFISGFSKISDIQVTQEIIKSLGAKVTLQNGEAKIMPGGISRFEIPQKLGQVSRACCLFAPVLLYRFGKAVFPMPGGDQIGARPIDRHLAGFSSLGVKIISNDGIFHLEASRLHGGHFRFPKNSHMGTENLIMLATKAEGETVIENAAQEPEVDDLISFLNKMGAKIKRIKSRAIMIKGVNKLTGADYQVMVDRNEAVTFGCAALVTRGDIFIRGAKPTYLKSFLEKLDQAGGGYKIAKNGIRFFFKDNLRATRVITAPHPGFMSDWQAVWAVLMSQAQGTSIIHETVFENRFLYLPLLKKMGVSFVLFNPKLANPEKIYNFNLEDDRPSYRHAVRIFGPTSLHGAEIEIGDVRAGATMTLAALAAEGQSKLLGLEHLDRGYENLDGRLRSLGAKIKRV